MCETKLEVRPAPSGAPGLFLLFQNSRSVGHLCLHDLDIADELVCDVELVIRRPRMSAELVKKHVDFGKHEPDPPGWGQMQCGGKGTPGTPEKYW